MNLQDLVPPLELCKLIPKGEFEDSALVWAEIKKENEVKSYIYTADMVNYYATSFHKLYPAPTLQEILAELKTYKVFGNKDFSIVESYEELVVAKQPVIDSAMEFWLKVKGVTWLA
jgi:hypothetical protein